MAAGTEAELTHRLREHSEVIKFAQEVLSIMTSGDLQHEAKKSADAVEKVRSKIIKSKENTHKLLREIEARKTKLKTLVDEYSSKCEDNAVSESNLSIARNSLEEVNLHIIEKSKDCKKLENERKVLNFHKKQRKLQRQVANIQFDLASTENHIKGYMKKSDGVETFEFDLTKDSLHCVSNFLWDRI